MEEKNKGKAKFEVSDIGGQVPSKHRTYRRTNNVKASKKVVRWADPKYVEEDVEMRTILGSAEDESPRSVEGVEYLARQVFHAFLMKLEVSPDARRDPRRPY